MGKYDALFDAPAPPTADPTPSKYAALFDEPAATASPPRTQVGQGPIGLSGPGSQDPTPSGPITVPVPMAGESKVPGTQGTPDHYQTGSLSGDAAELGKGFVRGAKDLYGTVNGAGNQIADVAMHPVATIGDERFRTEAMRGVNDNIPLANRAVEAIGGPPAYSSEDAAAFPNARALGNVAGLALPLGEAAGAVAKPIVDTVAKASKVTAGATEREIERAAEAYGIGATKKARGKLQGNVLDEDPAAAFHRVLSSEPELAAAAKASDPVRARAAEDVAQRGGADLKQIYSEADEGSAGKAKAPAQDLGAIAPDLTDRAQAVEDRVQAMMTEREGLPRGSVAREKLAQQIVGAKREALGLRRQAAEKITTTRRAAAEKINASKAPGIRAWDALPGWDAKITELADGTESEIAASEKLKALRDSYKAKFGEQEIVPAEELRRWQTDYQNAGYGKALPGDTAGSATIAANREASKIVGNPIVEHVTGMSYADAAKAAAEDPTSMAGRLFAANEKVAVANNVLAAVRSRVGNNPGAPHRLTALAHSAELGGHVAAAAGTHGASIPAQVAFGAFKHRHTIGAGIDKTVITAADGLAALARTVRAGVRPPPELVDAALKAGAKVSSVNAIMSRAPAEENDDGSDLVL